MCPNRNHPSQRTSLLVMISSDNQPIIIPKFWCYDSVEKTAKPVFDTGHGRSI